MRHTDAVTGGAGAVMLRDATGPIDRSDGLFGPFTNAAALGHKDLAQALELADELGVDTPLAALAYRRLADELGVSDPIEGVQP